MLNHKEVSPKFALDFPPSFETLSIASGFDLFSCSQKEAMNFLNHRFGECVKLSNRLSKCHEPKDFFNLQSEYWLHFLEDYFNHTSVLTQQILDRVSPKEERTSIVE